MKYSKSHNGIKLDIQANNVEVNETIEERMQKMIDRLQRVYDKIGFADVYIEHKEGKKTNSKSVKIRLGVPGPDAFAEDSGEEFMALFTNVENKLRTQLTKMKK